jgi:zinc finger SWIM domain-containing protein 3
MEYLNEIESSGQTNSSSPHVGMDFDTLEDAWKFWKCYGGKTGFDVRKDFKNEKIKGRITSRGFVCAASGHRGIDKRNCEVKRPRAETRTGYPVRLYLKLIIETQKYRVYEFCGDHNHALQQPEAIGLMRSQREIPEIYVASIDLADDSGIPPREGYELMGQEVSSTQNLPFSKRDVEIWLEVKQ